MKSFLRTFRDGRPWLSGHSSFLLHQTYNRQLNVESGFSDHDHLIATAKWLETAHDVTADGGVCGRYSLGKGWTSSYPETTGYIVPTYLNLAEHLDDNRFVSRANAAVDFLLAIQLSDGGFPGLEIADNRTQPSPFNTAQIIHGLVAWHANSGDERALTAACRAGDWILSMQDGDGAWRRHCYNNVASTYTAHLSCWLTHLGLHVGDDRYTNAAARHVDWILRQRDPETGWIDLAGFDEHQHKARIAYTHTIAYTLFGLLYTSSRLGLADGISAVEQAADGVARRLELSKSLPGMLDHRWRSYSPAACLTGNAQMAIVWFELYERNGDARLINAALKALDLVKLAQPMTNRNAAIRGGVPGSDPVWGSYLHMAIPNWSAKFFIDALLKKCEVLETLDSRPLGHLAMPNDVPTEVPAALETKAPCKVVLYASPRTQKVSQMLEAWAHFDFKPYSVVVSHEPETGFWDRLLAVLRAKGLPGLVEKLFARGEPAATDGGPGAPTREIYADPTSYCRDKQIRVDTVGSLESPEAIQTIRDLAPDIAVHAGAGLLHGDLLNVPRMGTLNAHMGILPHYRGMNVTEWAHFNGDPIGCTVHLIDEGIDTGPIVCVREVETDRTRSVADLRDRVNAAQLQLLGEVLNYVVRANDLPPLRIQRHAEGVQYFRMHEDLLKVLDG